MTRPHHRHLRIIWTGRKERPWVVQSCLGGQAPHVWQDILRFDQSSEAESYVEEIAARDRALLEAER